MRIAYIATNYPYVSHSFIQGEILALEDIGVDVVRIALNRVRDEDVQSATDVQEAARTYAIKATPVGEVAATVATTALRHPIAVAKLLALAWRGPGGMRHRVTRLGQAGEAILVWRHCSDAGVHALHAHFGQAPASVARFTTALGNAIDPGRWTWSLTVHGWHEFATEDTSELTTKFVDAGLVVCISDFTRAQVSRLTPFDEWDKVVVVRCGVDLDQFNERPPRPVGDVPVVVVVARLSPEKGHVVLLDAAAELHRRGREVTLRFVGDGSFGADIARAARRRGLEANVDLTGALEPELVSKALRDADVFCLPSFAEGLPVSIMEAMAVGVPVVTTYISGVPELVDDGRNGWLVPAGNPGLLADALEDAIASPRRDEVIQAARRAVEAGHDRSRNILALAEHLRRCHEPGASRPAR